MRIIIRGKSWNLRFCRLPNDRRGDCESPYDKGKTIRISKTLAGQEKLEVLLHEMLHAGVWDLSEEAVDELSTDMAQVLYKLGWRDESD